MNSKFYPADNCKTGCGHIHFDNTNNANDGKKVEKVTCYDCTEFTGDGNGFSGACKNRVKYSSGDMGNNWGTQFGYPTPKSWKFPIKPPTRRERAILKILNDHRVFSSLPGCSTSIADELDNLVIALKDVE